MILTTKGEMDEALLRRVDGSLDNDNESTTWVEYYLGDELVHRSASVTLKQAGVIAEALAASLGA
jgi:hypothetical protein